MRVLSTKILPVNLRQMLLNAGVALIQTDFIKTRSIKFELDKINDILLFTSQNAVESVLQNPKIEELKQHNAICVGIKTKAMLESHGFKVLACKDYAAELAQIITSEFKNQSITFFAGNIRRDTLPEAMTSAGIKFDEIRAYETVLNPHKVNAKVDGILFYSPSGINSYLKHNKIDNQICFCIGTTTAETLEQNKNIVIANRPTVENTVIQCINHFKNTPKS